jgi:hypothetical protein
VETRKRPEPLLQQPPAGICEDNPVLARIKALAALDPLRGAAALTRSARRFDCASPGRRQGPTVPMGPTRSLSIEVLAQERLSQALALFRQHK